MFYVKNRHKVKVDRKRPESHPGYGSAVAAGRARMARGELKFDSEGHKRDYKRAVLSNPNNVMGLPPFYPPLQIPPMAVPQSPEIPEHILEAERIRRFKQGTVHIFCRTCERETPHGIDNEQAFCKKCGNIRKGLTNNTGEGF